MLFRVPCFVPGKTLIEVNGKSIEIHPMQPGAFRPGNFLAREFSAPLVYLGVGDEAALASAEGVDLNGAIVVMEFASGADWQRVLRFGVIGFIFLDHPQPAYNDAIAKATGTEVRIPRFLATKQDSEFFRDVLKSRAIQAQVTAEPSRWENKTLRNLWVIIPGSNPTYDGELALITAPMDANSIVPGLSEGAQNAANLSLLLRLFHTYRQSAPERGVVLCAVNAHTRNFLGDRILAWNLLTPREQVERLLDTINADLRQEKMLLSHYQPLQKNLLASKDSEEYNNANQTLVALRDLMDSTTGKNFTVKEPLVDLARREVNKLKAEQLRLSRRDDLDASQIESKRNRLETARHDYVQVLTLFNKVGIRTELKDLNDLQVKILKNYVDEIVSTRMNWSRLNQTALDTVVRNNSIRATLGKRQVKVAVALELTFQNGHIGFSAHDFMCADRWQHKFGINSAEAADKLQGKGVIPENIKFVDALTKQGGLAEGHFFPKQSETVAIYQAAGPTPAFALRNLYTDYGNLFLTSDIAANLDKKLFESSLKFIPELLKETLAVPVLTSTTDLKNPTTRAGTWQPAWGIQVKAFKFDEFSATVLPQLPVPGSALVLHNPADASKVVTSGDVMTGYMALTDERAVAVFYGITAPQLLPNAFKFDKDFTVVKQVVDAGDAESKMSSTIQRGATTKTLAMFDCVEYPIYTRDNPAAIGVSAITENTFLILDGRLNTAPKKFGMAGIGCTFSQKAMVRFAGPVSVFLERDEAIKLLTSERILALNATEENPEGDGFKYSQGIGNDFFETASGDLSILNHAREERLSGTSDALAKAFVERGDKAIERMKDAKKKLNWMGYLKNLHEAIGAHGKAYKRMAAVTNDMLKAVVFYLALMLPFCFFTEKLLFKFKRIEHEMVAFCIFFALTFVVFRNIHPAFRVAQAPEAIFIAFVMGGLGAFVIKILHGRFEGEMTLLFRPATSMDAGEVGFSTVGQSAMLIGVNNMKRRRIRTALTTVTVILVTFTMLAFTSITKNLSPTIISRSKNTSYTGLMYHWPGNARMDEATLRTLKEILNGHADLAVRRWLIPPKLSDGGTLPFRIMTDNGAEANIDAILGLPVKDNGFIGPIPIKYGKFFSSDDANEVVLPESLSKALGLTDETYSKATLTYEGRDYKIVGLLSDADFLQFKDINQRPLIPIKNLIQQGGGDTTEALTAMASGDEESTDDGVFYTDLASLVIMPVDTLRKVGGQPYSISAKLKEGEKLWPVVDELLTITNASKFFISSTEPFKIADGDRDTTPGVYYVGEGYRTSIGGMAFLIIPLLISSTIILNTMLGSVYERKAEIAIYNAVGLNPTHIGMFFLAEAFVYSVIGSVGGYLIGQATSILLTKTGWVKSINLNFSSLSVVYVIMFTIAVVLLSTIYPSVVATRAAVPSGKRKWSLPEHDGKQMPVIFPFIYQHELIYGINGYLSDYFSRFTEASFGDLIAEFESVKHDEDDEGRDILIMTYNVALAPFDLGVTQQLKFTTQYDEKVQAFRLVMLNTRRSGQDSNWTATNMPFLEKLRTYLMYWRNLTPAEHADFAKMGKELFNK
jgi:ABC-type antimicrobial peptide transport system permease subunit